MIQWPDLSPVLGSTLWAVVGAAATRLYMPERFTYDFDVVVAVHDADIVRRKLADAGYSLISQLSIGGFRWQAPDGRPIDVLEGHDPWWPLTLVEAQQNRDAQGLPILPLPYLVLMKFQASRTINLGDISRMLGLADEAALKGVRALFSRYAPADLEDLESLILLGRREMGGLHS